MWRYITPSLLVLILIATWIGYKPMTYDKYVYPDWVNGVGWMVSFISVTFIPTVMAIKLIFTPGTLKEVINS